MANASAPNASAPNASTAQARVLVDELARCGVRHVIVCPGSRSAALAIAAGEDPRLAVHVHPDERSAGFVALGIGRVTGVPAAVVVTSGSAVANLHPAAVEADTAAVPLLLVTADRPPELRGTGANQTIVQRDLLGPGLRWAVELGVAEDRPDAVRTWRATAARAVATAAGTLGGPPGPVQLDVPMREPTVPVTDDGRVRGAPFLTPLDGRGAFRPWVEVRPSARPRVDDATRRSLAARMAAVERGLIVVGAEVGPGTSASAVDSLSRATGWPVLAEGQTRVRGGGRALRAGSWLAADDRFARDHLPDLVVRIGRPTVQGSWRRFATAGEQVLIDPHGAWHDPWRSVTELVVAAPEDLLTAVASDLGDGATSDWWEAWATADAVAAAVVGAAIDASEAPTGLGVAREVLTTVPDDALLVVAASLAVRDVDLLPDARRTRGMVANRGAAGIDGTVGTGLGASVGARLPAWSLLGDQALLHDLNGLLLHPGGDGPDATLVVVDNGGGRIFDGLPPGRHAIAHERLFAAPHGLDLASLVRAHGIPAIDVADGAELRAALSARADDGRGLAAVVVHVDPEVDLALRRAAAAAVRDALGRPA